MKIRFSWLAGAGAALLVVLAVPAAPAGASLPAAAQAGPSGAAAAARRLPVATGDPRHVGQPRMPAPA
jgi:hypothetical protein